MYILFTPCAKSMATTKIIIQTVIGIFLSLYSFPQDNRYSLCAGNSSLAIGLHLSHYFPPALTTTNFSVVNKPLTLSLPFPKILPEELHMNGKGMYDMVCTENQ